MADNQLKARQVYKNIAYNGVFGDTYFGNVIKTEIPGRAGDDEVVGKGIPGRAGDDAVSRGSGRRSKMREKSFRQGA